jgi:hypothetical protein
MTDLTRNQWILANEQLGAIDRTAQSIIDQLQEGLISPVEALMWLAQLTTIAQHDPIFDAMCGIILQLDKEEKNVYGISQD